MTKTEDRCEDHRWTQEVGVQAWSVQCSNEATNVGVDIETDTLDVADTISASELAMT